MASSDCSDEMRMEFWKIPEGQSLVQVLTGLMSEEKMLKENFENTRGYKIKRESIHQRIWIVKLQMLNESLQRPASSSSGGSEGSVMQTDN